MGLVNFLAVSSQRGQEHLDALQRTLCELALAPDSTAASLGCSVGVVTRGGPPCEAKHLAGVCIILVAAKIQLASKEVELQSQVVWQLPILRALWNGVEAQQVQWLQR